VCRARVINSSDVPRPIVEDLLSSFGEWWDRVNRRSLVVLSVGRQASVWRCVGCVGGNRCAPNVCAQCDCDIADQVCSGGANLIS
jgi:hypothetical protein